MKFIRIISFLTICIFSLGCATSIEERMNPPVTYGGQDDSYDEESTADGAAFLTDAIHVRHPMPKRPTWRPLDFYYKHCTSLGKKSFYSKHEYDCSGPY